MKLPVLSLSMAALLATALEGGVPLNPNTRKYEEHNPPSSGRAGTATLSSRILTTREGLTLVHLTTGGFDGEPGTGRIVRVQTKAYDSEGRVAFTRNQVPNVPESEFRFVDDILRRGQPLQLQAGIRGVDGRRTDVVTVTDVVRAVPDLRVDLNVPDQAPPGLPVTFTALISEANGDIGGRANCVLYVDGIEADRADGIWIDGGGAVSCAFSRTFDEIGTHQLRVAAESVQPAEWNDADNTAEATIEIRRPENRFRTALAKVDRYDFRDAQHFYGSYDGGAEGNDWDNESDRHNSMQSITYIAWMDEPLPFPLTIRGLVSTPTRSDGVTFAAHGSVGDPGECQKLEDFDQIAGRRAIVYVSSCPYGSMVHFARNAGAVTYLSRGLYRFWHRDAAGQQQLDRMYWWFGNSVDGDPEQVMEGHDFVVGVEVDTTDGATWRSPIAVHTVRTVQYEDVRAEVCETLHGDSWTQLSCNGWDRHQWTESGMNWVGLP